MKLVFIGLPEMNYREMIIQWWVTIEVFVVLYRHSNKVIWLCDKLDLEGQILKMLSSTWSTQVLPGALRNAYTATSSSYEGHEPVC